MMILFFKPPAVKTNDFHYCNPQWRTITLTRLKNIIITWIIECIIGKGVLCEKRRKKNHRYKQCLNSAGVQFSHPWGLIRLLHFASQRYFFFFQNLSLNNVSATIYTKERVCVLRLMVVGGFMVFITVQSCGVIRAEWVCVCLRLCIFYGW